MFCSCLRICFVNHMNFQINIWELHSMLNFFSWFLSSVLTRFKKFYKRKFKRTIEIKKITFTWSHSLMISLHIEIKQRKQKTLVIPKKNKLNSYCFIQIRWLLLFSKMINILNLLISNHDQFLQTVFDYFK